MRVLHCTWNAAFGGIERLIYDLSVEQLANHDVALLLGRKKGEFLNLFEESEIVIHDANLRFGYDLVPASLREIRVLMESYDLVHLHAFVPAFILAAAQSHVPQIYTEHGNFGFGRDRKPIDGLNRWFLQQYLNRKVDYLTCNSRFTYEYAQSYYALGEHVSGEVLYNGIMLDRASRIIPKTDPYTRFRPRTQGKFVVGTTTRLAGFKRVDRLIRSFQRFAATTDSHLLIVGEGVERKSLEVLVADLGLEEDVTFTGYQEHVSAFQAEMDVCVFPSQREPFGLVAVESLALGKPTLVFEDGGGIVEIIEAVASDDIVADEAGLAARLHHYYEHGTAKDREARVRRALEFDIRRMAARFDEIYQEVAETS